MNYQLLEDPRQREDYVLEHIDNIQAMLNNIVPAVKKISLKSWNERFIYPYDPEAKQKIWVGTQLQNTMGDIWDNNNKSRILAPREHLKTHTALSYALKKVFTRDYPLEINYYHQSGELAAEKFRKMQLVVERNPLLRKNFDIDNAKSWSAEKIELSDGTIILPMSYFGGSVGKHPHIIILDDIIDFHVIYSDVMNKKASDIFYMNIYPQISKDDPDKKIIIIGTAQRKDDIYHKLPGDFKTMTYQAVNERTRQVLSPEIFTFERLMKIKKDISQEKGERYWLKEYMNVPLEGLGIIVKSEYIQYFPKTYLEDIFFMRHLEIIQGWDLAVGKDIEKGDWTVGITLGIDTSEVNKPDGKIRIYVLEVVRGRWDFGQRLKMIKQMYDKWTPLAVGIEEVAFQYDTVQQARNLYALPIIGVKAIKNKVESFQVEVGPYFENKQVYVLEGMDEFVTEMLSLPVGEFDDQADAFKIAVKSYLTGTGGKLKDSVRTEGEGSAPTAGLMDKEF